MAKKRNHKNILFFIIGVPVFLIVALGLISFTAKKSLFSANACGCTISENIDPNAKEGTFEGKKVNVPALAGEIKEPVLGASSAERWIEVDLSEQKIGAWEGSQLYLESLVSTGLPWWPTPPGEFRLWAQARATKMEGGSGRYYYYLPNVPYVMFFENGEVPGWRGFSLHGTYWHNDFGRVHSHGCVNLPTPIAEKLFYWTNPASEGKGFIRTDAANPGTRIVIHE